MIVQSNQETTEPYLTSDQLAEKLAVSRDYINRLAHAERLPYVRVGRKARRYRLSEVVQHLALTV